MVGLKTQCSLKHPEHLLFVDEVRGNLYCDGDKNVGGERHVMSKESEHAATRSNSNESRFTALGFTAATSDPVMCLL